MDIVFHTVVPNTNKLIPIIINLEPQSKSNPGYPLISRGIIYASRLLSLQEQGKTIEEFYNNIHKVYSIWICYNVSGPNENTIRRVEFTERVVYGNEKILSPNDYDLAQVWLINLGDCKAVKAGSLLRLLDVAFDKKNNMNNTEKMQVYKEEYDINDNVIAEEVAEMNAYVLDYAEEYAARAVAQARAEEREVALRLGETRGALRGKEEQARETALSMKAKGLPTDFIAECIHVNEAKVKEWLQAAAL